MRAFAILALAMSVSVQSVAAGRVITAGGSWAAIDRGPTCEAIGRAARIAGKGKVQAVAGFTFAADRRRWGEFHALLRRMPRPGTTVMLRVGDQPFLLLSRGNQAWSLDARQDQAIIAALRNAPGMSIEARDGAGQRFVDTYGSEGAATAIDAAAATCAGKIQPH